MMSESRIRVAVAAPHAAAVSAAREILDLGGNAVDAAIAAAAALTVVYPHMCSLGGDAIALVRLADGTLKAVNASGGYGSAIPVEELFKAHPTMPLYGPLTVSVPGAVSGWATLHDLGGNIPIRTVLAPAIRLAQSGCEVSPGLARAIAVHRERLEKDPGMSAVFFRNGSPLMSGEILLQPALAATLERLAGSGLQSFYSGAVGAAVSMGLTRLGVPTTQNDFSAHTADVSDVLSSTHDTCRVFTAPPNSQGFTFLRTLGALSCAPTALTSKIDTGLLAELFRSSDKLRDDFLADPRFADVPIEEVLSKAALLRGLTVAQNASALLSSDQPESTPARPDGDTVAVCVVDDSGNAVSLIQSTFYAFGSGLLEPETGIVLHNRAASFSLDSASPNVIKGGKRPAHTLVPVIIEYADGAIAAHGTMGGNAQSQIHVQLLLSSLRGSTPTEAVSAPRFVVSCLDNGENVTGIQVESGFDPQDLASLARTSLTLTPGEKGDPRFGHAMIARLAPDKTLSVGADPRSDGSTFIS